MLKPMANCDTCWLLGIMNWHVVCHFLGGVLSTHDCSHWSTQGKHGEQGSGKNTIDVKVLNLSL